jgi:Glycosyl transferase family 2
VHDVVVVTDAAPGAGAALNAALERATGDLIAPFDSTATYEEHFLTDLAHAFSYTDAGVVGKGAREHSYTEELDSGAALIEAGVARRLRFDDDSDEPVADLLGRCRDHGVTLYAADRFSFIAGERSRARV